MWGQPFFFPVGMPCLPNRLKFSQPQPFLWAAAPQRLQRQREVGTMFQPLSPDTVS